MHYAAKNDAVNSLKMLLKLNANVSDRDFKNRTPLQIAAELGEYIIPNFFRNYKLQQSVLQNLLAV